METTVCAGVGITRAQIGSDYLEPLRARVSGAAFVREGVNGDLAWNLLQRLDAVVAAKPSAATVLIGTNDIRAALGGPAAEALIARNKPPVAPTLASFTRHLGAVAERLTAETGARVALLSPPVLGQDPDGEPARLSAEYADAVAKVAAAHGVAYLPLHETQPAHLRALGADSRVPFDDSVSFRNRALAQRLLRRGWDDISRRRGLALATDHVHQNSTGAGMIADLIAGFLA